MKEGFLSVDQCCVCFTGRAYYSPSGREDREPTTITWKIRIYKDTHSFYINIIIIVYNYSNNYSQWIHTKSRILHKVLHQNIMSN